MARDEARARKVAGTTAGPVAVCCAGRPTALLGRLALSAAAVAFSLPAYAQVSNGDVAGISGTAITGNTTLSGTLNGNNGAGYFVTSTGTLTINNGLLENFTTTGGSGSGGGLGAGGAIFIDTGGTVILNGTSFSHDTAVGGLGGTSSPYGGDLNNISPVGLSPGTSGTNGTLFPDNEYVFGDGRGNGVPGIGVTAGGNATDGVGGIGGVGGPGGNGWTYNPIAEANNDIAIANIAATSGVAAGETAIIVTFVAGAVAELASSANPFEDPLAPITGISSGLLAVVNAINLAADGTAVGAAVENQQITQGVLNTWTSLYQAGIAGNGGNGENGGNGGSGSYGFGGGGGGQGGAYGLTENPAGTDGTGGAGGAGGAGGFGGGGGAGGYGFGANQNGCGGSTLVAGGCTSTSGAGGVGGAAGFGGGVGSTGGATGVSNATGGGGGDAYGGAIFVNSGASLTITGNATFSGDNAIGGASLNNGPAGGAAGTDLFMMQGATVDIAPGASAGNIPNVVTFNGTIADNSTSSIGAPTVPQTAGYPVSGGAYLTIFSGITVFNGANTYSGQTVINGGALGGPLNTGANTAGAPNYALTDGALQATDGVGLPTASNLNFSGPNQFTGGVLQIAGTVLSNGVVQPTMFTRTVSPNPNPDGGSNPGGVQWTGSGGFAALNAPLIVTLSGGAPLSWSDPTTPNGFVPFGSSLIFGSADSNNTVTFTNAIDITGGSYSAGTAASILVANNGNALGSTAIMSGVISGAGDLSIGGGGFNGTLVLSAANTYTGGTYVNSGTLAFSGNGSIADSSGLFIANTGSLDISQSKGVTIPTLTGSGTVFLGGQELTVANGGTFSGTLADGGIAGGTKGSLIIGGGTETLSGTNTYTGDTTINFGATLALTGTGSIADSSPVLDNGIFDISQTAQGAAITSLSGSGQALIGSNLLVITNGSTTFSGDINDGGLGGGTGGSLVVAGGTETLSGVNTYTGVTIVESGATLALSGTGSIATSSLVDAVGTFDISQTSAGASITTLAGTGEVALGKQALTITKGSTTFGGVIADGGIDGGTKGSLIIGGGTQTLTGTNTYTGNTTIDGSAVLALAGTGSISQSSDVIANGTFDISQTSLGTTITTLSGSGNVALGSELLLITNGSTTFSGVLADGGIGGGTGGMLGVSGGTQTLTGINKYTGGSLIGSGATLALSAAGSIADSAGVFDDGTFDISQTSTGASIATLLGNGLVSLGAQTLTITNGSTTFAGVIADGGIGHGTGGSLIVSGGTETLSGTNTYTGTTTTDLGTTLALSGTGSIASSSDVIDNGTFDISQTTSGASIQTLSGGGSTNLGAQTLTITDGATTFSGVIADGGIVGGTGGNLTVSGGTQTLSGINTYTGVTTIAPNPSSGTATLALLGSGSIATSSEVSIATNGTFDISQTTAGASITTLSGSGNVALGGQTLTITAGAAGPDGTNPAGIFSGVIANGGLGGGIGGSVALTGGHEELTGVNTYTGGTSITGGAILSVNNSNSLGADTSPLTINNGTLLVDASITIPQPISFGATGPNVINLDSNNVTLSGALSGPGGFYALNGGTLNLTGTISNIGSIVIGQGTQLTASSTASAGLASTPIVVLSPGGSAIDVFTGSVHVVGALDILNDATPELIILPGDQLVGIGSVNIATVIQGGGGGTPGDGAGTMVATASLTYLPSSTYTAQIDGAVNSAANCPFPANPSGCAGQYSSTIVVGAGNTFTAAGTLAPQLTGIGAPANNNYIPPVTSSFIVVQAQGGVLGSFSNLVQPALGTASSGGLAAGTRIDALYYNTGSTTPITSNAASSPNGTAAQYAADPNAIALWVTPASYTNLSSFGISLSQNELDLGAALNALRGPAGVRNNEQATWDFGYLFAQQPKNLPNVFDTLTGEVNADAAEGAFQLTNQFLGLMLDPFNRPFSPGSNVEGGSSHSALGFAAEDPQPGMPVNVASQDVSTPPLATKAATFDQRWLAWGAGLGAYSNISGDPATAGTHNFSTSTYGFAGGMDYSIPDALFGFAVAGGGNNWTVTQENLGTGNSYDVQAGLYGRTNFGHAYLGAAFSVANNWMKTNRTPFAGAPLNASFDAQTFGGRVEAGYGFIYNAMKITPFAAGQVLAFHSPDYGETDLSGGGFALNYAARTETDLSSQLGGRFETATSVSNMPLVVRLQAAWEHDWVNDAGLAATFQAGLAPGALPGAGTSFVVTGAALPQNLAVVSAATDLYVTRTISINAKFDGQIASGAQTYGGSLTFRDAW